VKRQLSKESEITEGIRIFATGRIRPTGGFDVWSKPRSVGDYGKQQRQR